MIKTVTETYASSAMAFEFVQHFMIYFGCRFEGWDAGVKHGDGNITASDPHATYARVQQALRRWRLSGARVEIEVEDTGELFLMYALGPHGTADEVVKYFFTKWH